MAMYLYRYSNTVVNDSLLLWATDCSGSLQYEYVFSLFYYISLTWPIKSTLSCPPSVLDTRVNYITAQDYPCKSHIKANTRQIVITW